MKKMLKIALCAVLTLALVFSFVACSDDAAKDEEVIEEVDGEEEAEKVVESFMDGFCEFDIKEMSKYCVDGDAFTENIGYEDFKQELIDRMSKEFSPELAVQLEPLFEGMVDIVSKTIEYKITDIEKDGDDYVVTVEYSSIDFEELSNYSNEAFSGENSTKMGEELAQELIDNGTITESSTQEEVVEALIAGMTDKVLNDLEGAIDDFEKVEKTVEITVVEDDGEWLIDEDSVTFVKTFLE